MNKEIMDILKQNVIIVDRNHLITFIRSRYFDEIQIEAHKFNSSVVTFRTDNLEYICHGEEDIDLQNTKIIIDSVYKQNILAFLTMEYSDVVGILPDDGILRFQMDDPKSDNPSYFELKIPCRVVEINE